MPGPGKSETFTEDLQKPDEEYDPMEEPSRFEEQDEDYEVHDDDITSADFRSPLEQMEDEEGEEEPGEGEEVVDAEDLKAPDDEEDEEETDEEEETEEDEEEYSEEEEDEEGTEEEDTDGEKAPEEALKPAAPEVLEDDDPRLKQFQTKLVVNGVDHGAKNFEDVKRLALKGLGAAEKFRAAAEQVKLAENVLDHAKKDPIQTAMKLLQEEIPYDQAYQYILQQCQEFCAEEFNFQSLSPAEKARIQTQRELEAKNQRIQELETERQSAAEQRRNEQIALRIVEEANTLGLPNDFDTLNEICKIWNTAQQTGEDLTPREAAERFRDEHTVRRRQSLESLSDDELRAMGLQRAKPKTGKKSKKKPRGLPKHRATRQRRPSTNSATAAPQEDRSPFQRQKHDVYFSDHDEAWEDAQQFKRRQRQR